MAESILVMLFVVVCVVYPCSLLGYLIAFKQQRFLITGWRDEKYKNPEKVASVIGKSLIAVAIIVLFISVLMMLGLAHSYFMVLIVISLVFMPIVILIYVNKNYGIRNNT